MCVCVCVSAPTNFVVLPEQTCLSTFPQNLFFQFEVCVFLFVVIPFILDARLHFSVDMWTHQPGSHRGKGHTGVFSLHLPSAVLALICIAKRIQPFFILVDREVDFFVPTTQSFSTCWA